MPRAARRVALFDLDNTLFDRSAAFRRWADSFVEERSLPAGAAESLCRADDDGFATRRAVFEWARRRFSLSESVPELETEYRARYPAFFVPDQTVGPALARLRREGWRIGVVTNGPPSQRVKVERAGLWELIDDCTISDEVGSAKPARAIFELALRRCGAAPADAATSWMVGDAPGPDIAGARAVGLRTVWIHRGRSWPESGYRPDAVADSVPEAVETLMSRG